MRLPGDDVNAPDGQSRASSLPLPFEGRRGVDFASPLWSVQTGMVDAELSRFPKMRDKPGPGEIGHNEDANGRCRCAQQRA